MVAIAGTAVLGCDQSNTAPVVRPQLGLSVESSSPRAFEVYSHNIFLGGDTGPLFGGIDLADPVAVAAAATVFWQEVMTSDVPGRAAFFVDEIERLSPHLVGMQEVVQFVVLDAVLQPIDGIDLLAAVEAEINDRNLAYETLLVQEGTSTMLPLSVGAGGVTQWLAVTDRVVTLRRTDVDVIEAVGGVYDASAQLGPVDLERAWIRTSAMHDGTEYHFVHTQLETQPLAPIQALQVTELLSDVLAGLQGVTILAGDFNSNAEGSAGDPSWTPTYGTILDAGFADVWNAAPPADRGVGLTCCNSDLAGDFAFDQRLDFVFARSSGEDGLGGVPNRRGAFHIEIVGEEAEDRTASGLWPSDHAGLVASLWMPW